MKYMQTGGFERNPFMRLTLLWTLAFLFGLWITNFGMYFSRMNLSPASVAAYYLGSEADFRAPRSYESMLEVTHMHLPIMGIVVLILTHLMLFAPYRDRTKYFFITTGFLSALLEEGSGWLVRFVHPGFAWLKIFSFVTFQAIIGALLFGFAMFLFKSGRAHKLQKKPGSASPTTAD